MSCIHRAYIYILYICTGYYFGKRTFVIFITTWDFFSDVVVSNVILFST